MSDSLPSELAGNTSILYRPSVRLPISSAAHRAQVWYGSLTS
jgi:hypothetical protein